MYFFFFIVAVLIVAVLKQNSILQSHDSLVSKLLSGALIPFQISCNILCLCVSLQQQQKLQLVVLQ